jgi:hypothetical protein
MQTKQRLLSINAFYKADKFDEGIFSIIIDHNADKFDRALTEAYGRFKSLSAEQRQRYLDDIPRQLVVMKSVLSGNEGKQVDYDAQTLAYRDVSHLHF